MDDRFWDLASKRIEEEKCVLILGPDISLSESDLPLNERLKEYLESNTGTELEYYREDAFFSFKNNSEKEYAIMYIQDFYKQLQPAEIHHKIAAIPFHLIISVTPDRLLKHAFDNKGRAYQFAFYNKEQHAATIRKPTKNQPLLYNLFGDIETDGSLIFTYEDLFNYLIPSTGKFELPLELQQELQKARLVLFIGFQFDKWYFKLLLRLLNLHQDKLNRAPQLRKNTPPLLKNFYAEQFKIDFLQYSEQDIINHIYEKCRRNAEPAPPAGRQAEIFISYAWGDEREEIVDLLYNTMREKGWNIIRDKVDLGYKGNIKTFMESIGAGKYVVVVISDKYLRSENCMFEMLELQKHSRAYERIFPVVLRDADIYDEARRLRYITYWSEKTAELNRAYDAIQDKANTQGIVDRITLYANIRSIFDQVTVMLRNMNALTPEMHRSQNFSELIKAIERQIQHDNEKPPPM